MTDYLFTYGDAELTVSVDGAPTDDLGSLIGAFVQATEALGGTVTETHVTEGEALVSLSAT